MSFVGASRVLIEGLNLTLAAGTGIATYARNLADAVRELGYRTDVVVGSNRAISQNDPQHAEIVLHDGPRHFNLIHKGYLEYRRLVGAPFGLQVGTFSNRPGTVAAQARRLDGFDHIHALPHMLDVERLHFMRHGKRLRLKLQPTPDIFHVTRPAPLEVRGAANVYTVHDVVPLRLPHATADDKAYHLAMLRMLVRDADHIVTVSEFSRQDIIALTGIAPSRISNTYQPVGFPPEMVARPIDQVADALRAKFDLDYKEYYLFVGAIEPKKNISRLVDAYGAAGVRRPLVLAGGLGWMYERDLARINSERFLCYVQKGNREIVPRRRVRHLSYLPLRDIVDLMRGARALLYPSIYEGFGLPAAEAMSVGTAVMTSNITSLPEIAGDAALLVDPYDTDAMTNAIRTLDRDDDLIADLASRGLARARMFSAETHAQRLQEIYRSLGR